MTQTGSVVRASVDYNPTYQRFVVKEKNYDHQFSHIYVSRLLVLREALINNIQSQQNLDDQEQQAKILEKVVDLVADNECILVGTLLKILQKKPDLFEAVTSEEGIESLASRLKDLASDSDTLVLEDESGRVKLVGSAIHIHEMVTGAVIGVRGSLNGELNEFNVSEVYTPGLPPQRPLPTQNDENSSHYIALVSGLEIGKNYKNPLSAHVLMDYLAGRLGDVDDLVSKIVRTIVVGNSIAAASNGFNMTEGINNETNRGTLTSIEKQKQIEIAATPMKNMDELLSTLAAVMPVDIMPGENDPSNYALPQQSFHPCLFPASSRFTSFRSVTNPYEASFGGVQFLGHSGQPIHSILQCTKLNSKDSKHEMEQDSDGNIIMQESEDETSQSERVLDALQHCIEWRHVAPTAPDLLACFPLDLEDPFILETCPHVFFAGNQDSFSSRRISGRDGQQVQLITVPSFAETGTIVLVDLNDLSCFPIFIDI